MINARIILESHDAEFCIADILGFTDDGIIVWHDDPLRSEHYELESFEWDFIYSQFVAWEEYRTLALEIMIKEEQEEEERRLKEYELGNITLEQLGMNDDPDLPF